MIYIFGVYVDETQTTTNKIVREIKNKVAKKCVFEFTSKEKLNAVIEEDSKFKVKCEGDNLELTENDLIVILGDAGLNYYGNDKGDSGRKRNLNKWNVPILCVHGNHEMRPESLATYSEKEWNGGTVYYEEEFPNIRTQENRRWTDRT